MCWHPLPANFWNPHSSLFPSPLEQIFQKAPIPSLTELSQNTLNWVAQGALNYTCFFLIQVSRPLGVGRELGSQGFCALPAGFGFPRAAAWSEPREAASVTKVHIFGKPPWCRGKDEKKVLVSHNLYRKTKCQYYLFSWKVILHSLLI